MSQPPNADVSTTAALTARVVKAVHGRREIQPDPAYELGLSQWLREKCSRAELLAQVERFAHGLTDFDALMRRALWRALAKQMGHGVRIEPGAGFKHVETFELSDGVFIGAQAYIQGRFDGVCRIGARTWIGPQAYFDARALIIEEDVGWGPGAKVLGSAHTGVPADVPIIQTDLEIKPVRIGAEADIGVNAVILPGVTIGKGAMIGAGAVVNRSVPDYEVWAGVPAQFIRRR